MHPHVIIPNLRWFCTLLGLLLLISLPACTVNEDGVIGGGEGGGGVVAPTPPDAGGNNPPAPTAPPIITTEDTPGTSRISINDPDIGQTHTFAILSLPVNGTATVADDGLVTYTPNEGFIGDDSLEVTVSDDGSPPLSGAVTIDVSVLPTTLTDLNADGLPDLVTANQGANSVSIFFAQPDGTFLQDPTVSPIATGTAPVAVAIADLNADDRLDLVTANQGANSVSIFFAQPDGTFLQDPTVSPIATSAGPAAIAIADLNADDRLDLVTANQGANSVSVFFGLANGTFQEPPLDFRTGAGPTNIAIAD